MSCGGRVYKGNTVTISVPFDVEHYKDLTITYSTTGDSKIVKTQQEVTIEDGFITYTFQGHDLDLLPDGVIYYTIEYESDGVDYVASTNTPLYLKTPAGYSGLTADEIYQQGYEDGLEHCSGYTPCDCTSAVTEAYQSGYTEGYNQGQEDCPECSGSTCNIQPKTLNLESGDSGNWFVEPDDGYDGLSELTVKDDGYGQMKYDSGYTQGYGTGQADQKGKLSGEYFNSNGVYTSEDGWSSVTVNVPLSSITITENGYYIKALGGYDKVFVSVPQYSDCSSAITEAFESGYTQGYAQGQEDCPECSGSSCNLQNGELTLTAQDVGMGSFFVNPDSGYDGFDRFQVIDDGYGQQYYDDGYSAGYAQGQEDCPECSGTSCNLQAGGISLINVQDTYYPSSGYDGFSSFYVDATTFEMETYTRGYNDGLSQSGCNLENVTTAMSIYSSDIHVYPSSGYAGMSHVYVDASSMRNYSYESGVTDGFSSGYESGSTDGFVNGYQSGATDGYDSGYSDGYAQGQADCPECDCASAYTQGFDDGYQSGYTDGVADSSSAITEAYQSGFTAGEGQLHTIEVVIKTENSYYDQFSVPYINIVLDEGEGVPHTNIPYDQSAIIEGDGLDDYIGTYDFETLYESNPDKYYCSQIYDSTANTLTLCFKGYCINHSPTPYYPVNPTYACPAAMGVSVLESNINSWGNWSVETVRFNGRPLYDNNGGLSKIGNGGFKLVPTLYRQEPSAHSGYTDIFITTYAH